MAIRPGILVLICAAAAAQTPLPLRAPENVRTLRDLEYGRAGGKALLLDLYLPEKTEASLPLVIWIHGGGWAAGSKAGGPGPRLAGRGYAVASIDYRLSGEAVFPAQIEDCKAAVRWLRANAAKYNLDSRRFAAWGSSAGGHLVALLGTSGGVKDLEGSLGNAGESSRVQAVIDFFGPTDLLQMDAQAARNPDVVSKIKHDDPKSPESRLLGGALQENRAEAARANPIAYITRDDPPFLIMHGDRDPLVPLDQSRILYEALRAGGVEATFHIVKGGGHGFGGPEIDRMVGDFLQRHLQARPALASRQVQTEANQPPQWVKPPITAVHVEHHTFLSKYAGSPVSYLIYLPPGYEKGSRRYPVTYWLHGRGGAQTGIPGFAERLTRAIESGKAPAMIVVFVNGLPTGGYRDSADGKQPVESVTIKELVPHIDATYRTIAKREGRLVEGFSMGGSGAAKWAFKFPELFGSFSVFAGALHGSGAPASAKGPALDLQPDDDPWKVAAKNADRVRGKTVARITVGSKDGLSRSNTAFHEMLESLKIGHEFAVIEGVSHSPWPLYDALGDKCWAFYYAAFRMRP